MAPNEESPGQGPGGPHLLFFSYVNTGPYIQGEDERRGRATEMVRSMGGSCEIFRIAWSGFQMVSIVRGLSTAQVRELAQAINSWGAVQTTIVETSGVRGLRR
jgi:uncharacterized protein with GYD domain